MKTDLTLQIPYLVHRSHVDNAVPLRRHSQYLIQNLYHVQLLTLSIIKPVHNGGSVYSQLLQHSTSGGYREMGQRERIDF